MKMMMMYYMYPIFHSVVCTVPVYQIIVYKLVQPHAHTCTVSPQSDMFRWPATTIIMEGNSTDQKTLLFQAVCLVVHTSLYFAFRFDPQIT